MGAGGVPVKIVKIVKFATDVTEAVARREVVIVLGRELEKLASGDLTLNIETKFRGEQDEVRHSFNATVEKTAVLPWTCGMSFDGCKRP